MGPRPVNHLSAHLRRSGSHDALPFHRDCPACVRERMGGTPRDGAVVPAPARAGLAALVLAATAALAGNRATDPAHAQTETESTVDEAPPMVSPEELEGQLADPNTEPPQADDQGREDSRAGALKGGTYVVQPGDSLWRIARAEPGRLAEQRPAREGGPAAVGPQRREDRHRQPGPDLSRPAARAALTASPASWQGSRRRP